MASKLTLVFLQWKLRKKLNIVIFLRVLKDRLAIIVNNFKDSTFSPKNLLLISGNPEDEKLIEKDLKVLGETFISKVRRGEYKLTGKVSFMDCSKYNNTNNLNAFPFPPKGILGNGKAPFCFPLSPAPLEGRGKGERVDFFNIREVRMCIPCPYLERLERL